MYILEYRDPWKGRMVREEFDSKVTAFRKFNLLRELGIAAEFFGDRF